MRFPVESSAVKTNSAHAAVESRHEYSISRNCGRHICCAGLQPPSLLSARRVIGDQVSGERRSQHCCRRSRYEAENEFARQFLRPALIAIGWVKCPQCCILSACNQSFTSERRRIDPTGKTGAPSLMPTVSVECIERPVSTPGICNPICDDRGENLDIRFDVQNSATIHGYHTATDFFRPRLLHEQEFATHAPILRQLARELRGYSLPGN